MDKTSKTRIFEEANEFILPETPLMDFFDFLAGERL